jgi:hypothetical protein
MFFMKQCGYVLADKQKCRCVTGLGLVCQTKKRRVELSDAPSNKMYGN